MTAVMLDMVTPINGSAYPSADDIAHNLNGLPLHVAVLDRTGTIVSVNEAWRRFAAVTHFLDTSGEAPDEDPLGVDYVTFCERESVEFRRSADAVANGLRHVISGVLATFSFEYCSERLTERRFFLLSATPLPRSEQRGAVVTHLDITQLRQPAESVLLQAADAARASARRLDDFADLALEWFWETNPAYRVTALEGYSEPSLGLERERTLGRTLRELETPQGDPDKWRRHQDDLDARRPFRNLVYSRVDDNGASHYIRVSGKPYFDAVGAFMGYRGVSLDITAQVAAADRRAERLDSNPGTS